jgi:probable HAF family extracellular repeat protein
MLLQLLAPRRRHRLGSGNRTHDINLSRKSLPLLSALVASCGGGAETAHDLQARGAAERASQSRQSRYILRDLGTLGGASSNVNNLSVVINEAGTVVGGADRSDFTFHAFRWQNGALTDLGTLPGGDDFSYAIELNSSGLVAGISNDGRTDPLTGEPAWVATAWRKSQAQNLGTFGGSFSLPDGINDRGQIVGGAQNATARHSTSSPSSSSPHPQHADASRLWENGNP